MNFLTVALLFVCGCMSRGLKIKESKLNRRLLSRTTLNYQKTYVLYLTFGHMVEKKNPNHWNPNKNCEKMFNMDYTGEIKPYGTIALKVPHFVRNYIRKDMRLIMEAIFLKFLTISPENWLVVRPMVDEGERAKPLVGHPLTRKLELVGWGNDLTEREFSITKHETSYTVHASAIFNVFARYLNKNQLKVEARKGGTFLIFVGAPTDLFDTTKWEYAGDDYDEDGNIRAKYEYAGKYKAACVIAINHESPELKKYLETTKWQIMQDIPDELKKPRVLKDYNYKVIVKFVENRKKLQKGSYVANFLQSSAKVYYHTQVTDEWAVVNLTEDYHIKENIGHTLYVFPSSEDNWVAQAVKEIFVRKLNEMPGSSAARKTDTLPFVPAKQGNVNLKTELDAKDRDPFEFADLENPESARVSHVGEYAETMKSQMILHDVPVGTDQLTIDPELKEIHRFPSKEEEAPLPPKKIPEPPNDVPEHFVKLKNVPKYHDLQSYSRREVVFDNSIGEYVMKLVPNTSLLLKEYEVDKFGWDEEEEEHKKKTKEKIDRGIRPLPQREQVLSGLRV
eukprot:Platyproteum_vivax@DN7477_c2_g1_i1.p1